MKKLKTMRAGRLVRSVVYTAPSRQPESLKPRGPRRQISTEAQAKFNLSKSTDKLKRLIALNFPDGFWWVTLTYDDAHLPADRKAAGQIMRKFNRKLRAAWKLKKQTLYIYIVLKRYWTMAVSGSTIIWCLMRLAVAKMTLIPSRRYGNTGAIHI